MDYISIVEMADQAGVSGNTVIRYLSMFESYFSQVKTVDGIKKYPSHAVDILLKIHELSQRPENTKHDILEGLHQEFQENLQPDPESLSQTDNFGGIQTAVDRLTHALKALGPTRLDRLSSAVEKLTDALNGLPDTFAGIGQDVTAKTGDSVLDQLLTTKPDDGDDDPDLLELLEQNEDSGQGGDTLDILSISEGGAEDGVNKSSDSTLDNDQPESDDPDAIIVPFTKNDYSDYVTGLIVTLKGSGMTLKQIKSELEKRGLKTLTGLDSWSTGTISNLYNRRMND